eukprot:760276-Hanusia_phi.AAC.2
MPLKKTKMTAAYYPHPPSEGKVSGAQRAHSARNFTALQDRRRADTAEDSLDPDDSLVDTSTETYHANRSRVVDDDSGRVLDKNLTKIRMKEMTRLLDARRRRIAVLTAELFDARKTIFEKDLEIENLIMLSHKPEKIDAVISRSVAQLPNTVKAEPTSKADRGPCREARQARRVQSATSERSVKAEMKPNKVLSVLKSFSERNREVRTQNISNAERQLELENELVNLKLRNAELEDQLRQFTSLKSDTYQPQLQQQQIPKLLIKSNSHNHMPDVSSGSAMSSEVVERFQMYESKILSLKEELAHAKSAQVLEAISEQSKAERSISDKLIEVQLKYNDAKLEIIELEREVVELKGEIELKTQMLEFNSEKSKSKFGRDIEMKKNHEIKVLDEARYQTLVQKYRNVQKEVAACRQIISEERKTKKEIEPDLTLIESQRRQIEDLKEKVDAMCSDPLSIFIEYHGFETKRSRFSRNYQIETEKLNHFADLQQIASAFEAHVKILQDEIFEHKSQVNRWKEAKFAVDDELRKTKQELLQAKVEVKRMLGNVDVNATEVREKLRAAMTELAMKLIELGGLQRRKRNGYESYIALETLNRAIGIIESLHGGSQVEWPPPEMIPHISRLELSTVYTQIGLTHYENFNFADAKRILEIALNIRRQEVGDDDVQTQKWIRFLRKCETEGGSGSEASSPLGRAESPMFAAGSDEPGFSSPVPRWGYQFRRASSKPRASFQLELDTEMELKAIFGLGDGAEGGEEGGLLSPRRPGPRLGRKAEKLQSSYDFEMGGGGGGGGGGGRGEEE